MECMRALIEKDRQVEGCFTTYSSALARAALKKERYLNPETPKPRENPPPANGVAPESRTDGAPPPAFHSTPASPFADKLKQALAPVETEQKV